jgi:hypothetical protein
MRIRTVGVLILLTLTANPCFAAHIADLSSRFDYFANSWGLVGLKDYPNGCRIAPDWTLQLGDGVQASWRLGDGSVQLPQGIRRELVDSLPIVRSAVLMDGVVRYEWTVFGLPLPGRPYDYRKRSSDDDNFVIVAVVRATNLSPQQQSATLAVELASGGEPLALMAGSQAGVALANGRIVAVASSEGGSVQVHREGRVSATWALTPGREGSATFWLPYRAIEGDGDALRRLDQQGAQTTRDRAAAFWRRLLRPDSSRLLIPEPKVRGTYLASLAYTFIGRDDGRVHPGEGFYDGFFLRDGAFQVWGLEVAGYPDEARPSVLDFLNYQKPSGQFESQGGELDGNGQALWTLVRHYELTRDRQYLRQVYPAIGRSMTWLAQARQRQPDDPDARYAGVLPRSWADGEALRGNDYHVVGYDFWNLHGAFAAVRAAEALGATGDAEAWRQLAEEYRSDLVRLVSETGVKGFPPSLELKGTSWGNLTGIYPTRLFPPFHPRVSATLAKARSTFIEGTIRWCPETTNAIHPYMSSYITNSHVIRGEHRQAIEGLYALLLHSTSDGGFPEGVHYQSRTAWGNTVPHLWAAAQYVILLRNMLVREDGTELHLLSAIPDHWLAPGEHVAFRRAPTAFGRAGIRVDAAASKLRVTVDAPAVRPPQRIVIHTPPTVHIRSALARAGRLLAVREHEIVLAPEDAYVEIRVERQSASDPSYEATVARYLSERRGREPELRDVLPWPLEDPVDPARCVALDLKPQANVDPFAAPFGTLNPGKYLFTGMPVGAVTAAGIPFEIIDPTQNQGRAFCVLEGTSTSADFPREVEIDVGLAGTRAFFLGQVTGWMGSDPGDPKTHSVAEYVLIYEDGKRQVVPLVSQQTVDDWASPPVAPLTEVGLRGEPWHLSLLAVKLRPKRLERIIFRDHGTPAAPLLAAVAVERQ